MIAVQSKCSVTRKPHSHHNMWTITVLQDSKTVAPIDLFREEVKSIATANLLMWFPLVRSLQTLGATLNESLEPKYSGNEFELRGHLFFSSQLTLLHLERPKPYGVLTVLSAIGLREEVASVTPVKPAHVVTSSKGLLSLAATLNGSLESKYSANVFVLWGHWS